MSDHSVYPKAPVIEVMCVLAVDALDSLTEEVIGAFKESVADILPVYAEREGESVQSGAEIKQYLFTNKEETLAVTLYDNKEQDNKVIEFHILNSYSSVDTLYSLFSRIYDSYTKARAVKGLKFCQLGYLNKIVIPSKTITLSDYFTFTPNPNKLLVDFIVGYECEDELKFRTSVSLSPTKSDAENESAFILDVRGVTPIDIDKEETFSTILRRIHENIEAEFESAITDNTRKIFQGKL